MEQKTESKLSEWLDKMETESWQLELILSGFVIFLLLAGLEPYHALGDKINDLTRESTNFFILSIPYHIFRAALYVLTTAIILHVFLRGLWISTIGLRSVSGNIDWPSLKMTGRFENYLKKQVPSFDHYIEQLERYCSISFAFTFLMVFSILASGSFLLGLLAVQFIIRLILGIPIISSGSSSVIDDLAMLIYLILGIVYMIDFVTMGWLKRFKLFGKIYYPIYRFFGFITFASFYRPIYYNLIDNKLGRRLAMMILPIGIMVFVLMSLEIYNNAYLSSDPQQSSSHWFIENFYEDNSSGQVDKERPSIQSKIIEDNYIQLFVPYMPIHHDLSIEYFCPNTKPGFYTGLKVRGAFNAGKIANSESNTAELLDCHKQLWKVTINDSIYSEVDFKFYHHSMRNQYGLLALIPIHHFDHSQHFIKVDRQRYRDEEVKWFEGEIIWFYKN